MACSSFIFFIGVYNSSIVKTIIVEGAGLCPLQSKTVLLIGSEWSTYVTKNTNFVGLETH